tara:strand:- start:22491 stop:23144 length:654 start_codon:yes stop_codon:yes gene_type:complete
MDDFDTLLAAVEAHKKQCFHKHKCKLCKIKFDDGVTNDVHQCSYCDKIYDRRSTSMYMYECICIHDPKETMLCDDCNAANLITVVRTFKHGIGDYGQYNYGEKSFDDWKDGIYLDSCCSMTVSKFKTHKENCFHKSSCDICRIPVDRRSDYIQCDHCTELIDCGDKVITYWCDCDRCVVRLCAKCTMLNHSRIIEKTDEGGHFDCGTSPMIKAAKNV